MNHLGEFFDAGAFLLFHRVGVEGSAERACYGVGKPANHIIGAFGVIADPQVDVEPVRLVAELEQNMPQRQTVLAT